MKKIIYNLFNVENINKYKAKKNILLSFIFFIILIYLLDNLLNKAIPITKKASIVYTDDFIPFGKIIILLIFGSILEEIKYRLFLTNFKFKFFLISISVFFSDIVFLIFRAKHFSLFSENYSIIIFYYMGVFILAFLIFKGLNHFLKNYKKTIKAYYDNNFIKLLFIQAIFFSLWHVFFTNQNYTNHFIVVFVIQLFIAVYFSFIRINFGIKYSILIHFSFNFFGFSIEYLPSWLLYFYDLLNP